MAANQSVSMAKEETEKLSLISDTDLDTHKKISLLSLETENATTENKHGNTRGKELSCAEFPKRETITFFVPTLMFMFVKAARSTEIKMTSALKTTRVTENAK